VFFFNSKQHNDESLCIDTYVSGWVGPEFLGLGGASYFGLEKFTK
jgi:hypothetical protein